MKPSLRTVSALCLLVATLVLGACRTPGSGTPDPRGAYSGTLGESPGAEYLALILDDHSFWSLYGVRDGRGFVLKGFVQGHGVAEGASFRSADVKDFGQLPPTAGSMGARYDGATGTLAGTRHSGDRWVDFAGRRTTPDRYDHQATASIATVWGNWTLLTPAGQPIDLSIARDGALSGRTARGCRVTGTVGPHVSGRNLFAIQIRFGDAPCAMAHETADGIGVSLSLPGGRQQLLLAATNRERSRGFTAGGIRP